MTARPCDRYRAGQVELGKNPRTDECTEFVVLGDQAVGACAEQIQALPQREGRHIIDASPLRPKVDGVDDRLCSPMSVPRESAESYTPIGSQTA